MKLIVSYVLIFTLPIALGFTAVKNGHIEYNNQKIFFSGVNTPWVNYGRDFGSGAYKTSKAQFEKWLTEISAAGGNMVRVWVHVDAQLSPKFNTEGFATGEEVQSLIQDLGEFIDFAEKHNIFTMLCLWNLAVKPTGTIHLYKDEAKLNAYIDKVLKPIVAGLKNRKGLAAWDIINEPGGSITQNIKDSNPCWDTQILLYTGADWTGTHLTMKEVQKFINIHADAIKSVDPKALITVGDGDQTSTNISSKSRNYLSDHCLTSTGGKPKGTLDFYQLHSYIWQGKFPDTSPMKIPANSYKSDKPIIIGEMAVKCSESKNATQCFSHAYNGGYAGILSWGYDGVGDCSDGPLADIGMRAIRNLSNNGIVSVKID